MENEEIQDSGEEIRVEKMPLPVEDISLPLQPEKPDADVEVISEEILPAEAEEPDLQPEEQEAAPEAVSEEVTHDEESDPYGLGNDFDLDMILAQPEEPAQAAEEEAPAPQEPEVYVDTLPEKRTRPVRKGRPKRKKGYGFLGIPHILATLVWLAIILAIGVSLGRMMWLCASDVLAFGRGDREVTITVTAEDSIEEIAEKLHNVGLIRYPGLFKLYADIAVDDGEIAPGTFTLNTMYDYHAIVNGMNSHSSFRNVIENVVIPEGYNCRQIFALLEEKGVCSTEDLEAYAANGEFRNFWFLEGIERGDKYCLEGFLFPDTYEFYAHSTPREALGKMLTNFEARFTQELIDQLPELNSRLATLMRSKGCSEEFIEANRIDVYKLLIVASLVEEETANSTESPLIASVIYNRYTSKAEWERYLGIDAAIIYALGQHKEALTAEDLAIDSPYNTYKNAGLVPTPISNPGLDSITAALDFADSSYYYYILNPATGTHQFSRTLEEHEKLREQFRGAK